MVRRHMRSLHYRKNEAGDFQCGGHTRTKARPEDHSDTTTDPWLVDCHRCQASPVVKAASKAKREHQQARENEVREQGFDPNKPVGDMTPEEVQAFIAWLDSKKED